MSKDRPIKHTVLYVHSTHIELPWLCALFSLTQIIWLKFFLVTPSLRCYPVCVTVTLAPFRTSLLSQKEPGTLSCHLSPIPVLSNLSLPGLPVLGVWCAQTVQRSGPVTGPFPQHSPSGCICSRNQSLIPLGDHHDLFTHSSGPGPGFPSTLWRVGLLLRSPLLSSCVDVFFISLN